jgi:hypothetical protein
MYVKVVAEPWGWKKGDRLWWRDLPLSGLAMSVPEPGEPGSTFEIDITNIYNDWASGRNSNYGLVLWPAFVNNNFSTFYSTRAESDDRPTLELIY